MLFFEDRLSNISKMCATIHIYIHTAEQTLQKLSLDATKPHPLPLSKREGGVLRRNITQRFFSPLFWRGGTDIERHPPCPLQRRGIYSAEFVSPFGRSKGGFSPFEGGWGMFVEINTKN